MILGMVGCEVCSQTANAVAVMTEELTTSLRRGAVCSGDASLSAIE